MNLFKFFDDIIDLDLFLVIDYEKMVNFVIFEFVGVFMKINIFDEKLLRIFIIGFFKNQ